MANSKRMGKSYKEQYSAYKTQCKRDVNKLAKKVRHMKKHPNDNQSAKGGNGQIRSTPANKNSRLNPLCKPRTLNLLSGKLIGNAKLIMKFAKTERLIQRMLLKSNGHRV